MRSQPIRHARLRLDLGWSELAFGLARCVHPGRSPEPAEGMAAGWPEPEALVACLSVRSGFDLLLSSVDWPPGSEVVMSAITIPQMAMIVRHHGFTPVAVDVDPWTLEIDPVELRRTITGRTQALVYSSLFGSRPDLSAVVGVGHDAGLLVVEDRAQAFTGRPESLGGADVAMYSFGTIKTATCLGGAVLLIRDEELRTAIVERQARYPRQPQTQYAAKLLKVGLMLGVGRPTIYAIFTRLLQIVGLDLDTVIRQVSRTFPDANLLAHLRRRPCAALLALMQHRFETYAAQRVERRRAIGELYASELGADLTLLGANAARHTYWLFPILSADPSLLVAAGRDTGFDLTTGTSILTALGPAGTDASRAMQRVVYLPLDPTLRRTDRDRLLTAVVTAETAARTGTRERAA